MNSVQVMMFKVRDKHLLKFTMITPNRNGKYGLEFVFNEILGLLICTVISENQVVEKSISASNLRKFSGPANLDFFSRSPPRKKS